MGDITTSTGELILKDGENGKVDIRDEVMGVNGIVSVDVRFHENGKPLVSVAGEYLESKWIPEGKERMIAGVTIVHKER